MSSLEMRCGWWDHNIPGRDRQCLLEAGHKGDHQWEPLFSNTSLDRLAIFGRMVLEQSRESFGDVDGGWIQDKAIECGLLQEVPVTASCGDDCRCAEWDDFPQRCLRLTDAAKAVTVTEKTL